MLTMASVRAIAAVRTGLIVVLLPLAALIGLLDVIWTREAFNKRRATLSCWVVAAAGVLLGAASDPRAGTLTMKLAHATWAFVVAAAVAIALFVVCWCAAARVLHPFTPLALSSLCSRLLHCPLFASPSVHASAPD
jgi:hypothetical protein